MVLLNKKEETLFFDEKSAYDYIEKEKEGKTVHSAAVKYKKPTKKTQEGWVTCIHYYYDDPRELLLMEGE